MKEFILSALFVIAVLIGTALYYRQQCLEAYENYQPQWGIITQCRVMVDGRLTPVGIVRELK